MEQQKNSVFISKYAHLIEIWVCFLEIFEDSLVVTDSYLIIGDSKVMWVRGWSLELGHLHVYCTYLISLLGGFSELIYFQYFGIILSMLSKYL